ncbi:MAG: hypothetical protein EXR64_02020 [Dehalococcoidia bacterium]|nr:hypothetical protein [Dehalococcoidia bacterium]
MIATGNRLNRLVVAVLATCLLLLTALAVSCSRDEPAPVPLAAPEPQVPCLALEPGFTAGLDLTAAEVETLRQSCERIRTLRQRDVAVRLLDADGKPLRDAAVQIRQTRHAFLFGGQPNELARGVISAA